ncbi:hypothetical protein DFQ26_009640, partial [Actinomortierella ambigua]
MDRPSEALARARERVETQLDYRFCNQKYLQTSLNWHSSSTATASTATEGDSIEYERQAWLAEAVVELLMAESWGQHIPE